MFRELGESESEGFEVVTTFNAILKSQVKELVVVIFNVC